MDQIWLAFITGLTSGGISCLAVQGGLLASAISSEATAPDRTKKFKLVGFFLIAKLISYSLLGALLGFLGSKLFITPKFQGWMQILAGVFLILTAARLANLHPIFRYFVIQPPKFIYRILRKNGNSTSALAPIILGFLTVLIPCGVTQAMMLLAISSASAIVGAGIMFGFVLGTTPVFFALGLTFLELLKKKSFAVISALVIAILGIISVNTGQILRGSVHTLQNYSRAIFGSNTKIGNLAKITPDGKQQVTIKVSGFGYSADASVLKVGVPTLLTLTTENTYGCARAFTIPALNLYKILPLTGSETLEFTPTKTGTLTYTCSMGMYTGTFTVVN